MQAYITCDLPQQNQGFKPKHNWSKLKFLRLLEIYFGHSGTNNTCCIF